MKKLFLILLVSVVVMSALFGFLKVTQAAGPLVTCGNAGQLRCELSDIFALIKNGFTFVVFDIATPLAGLLIVIGGVYMVISAGNQGMLSKGKQMVIWSVVAWALIFLSYLIINTVLDALGYTLPRSF